MLYWLCNLFYTFVFCSKLHFNVCIFCILWLKIQTTNVFPSQWVKAHFISDLSKSPIKAPCIKCVTVDCSAGSGVGSPQISLPGTRLHFVPSLRFEQNSERSRRASRSRLCSRVNKTICPQQDHDVSCLWSIFMLLLLILLHQASTRSLHAFKSNHVFCFLCFIVLMFVSTSFFCFLPPLTTWASSLFPHVYILSWTSLTFPSWLHLALTPSPSLRLPREL